ADPVVEGRSLVVEAIRALAIACRAWAAYPSDHPNVTQAVGAAQTRVGEMLAAHGSGALGVSRKHLRVGVWAVGSPPAQALAHALYQRQAAVVQMDRGLLPEELQALVQWLASPAVPLEPGSDASGPPSLPSARHLHLQPLDYSAVRLKDETTDTTIPTSELAAEVAAQGTAPEPVSISERLLNVLLEWGTSDQADWGGEKSADDSTVPAEVAMVTWLKDFLQEQAAREHGTGHTSDGDATPPEVGGGRRGPGGRWRGSRVGQRNRDRSGRDR